MRWPPWKRREKEDVRDPQSPPVDLDDMSRQARFAENARDRAARDLRAVRARGEEVARLGGYFEVRLDRNHWAEMMQESFQRNRDG